MPHCRLCDHVRRHVNPTGRDIKGGDGPLAADGLAGVVHGPGAEASGLVDTALAAAQMLFSRQAIGPGRVPAREISEGLGLEFAWEATE